MWREAGRGRDATVFSHELTQLAAALTYYTVLSLLPALIVVVALLGLVGLSADTVHTLLDTLGELGAPWAAAFVSDVLDSVLTSQNSGIVLVVSLVDALWAASAYVGSFMVASDGIYEVEQRRPFWKSLPLRVGLALAAPRAALGYRGRRRPSSAPFGRWVADLTGIGTGPLHLWTWIKWPLLIALGLLLFALLYKFTPSRRQPALWWLLPGAAVGVGLWLARLRRLQLLPRQLRLVQPRVRHAGRGRGLPRVGVAREPLAAASASEVNRDLERRRAARAEAAAARSPRRIIGVHANRRRSRPPLTDPGDPCPTSPPSSRNSAASPPSVTS